MLEIVLSILDKLIHGSQNICGYLTLNEMHIKSISLIICSINNKLTNTPSTPPLEGKKQKLKQKTVLYIAHLIILCTSTETSIYWKFKDKIFNFS